MYGNFVMSFVFQGFIWSCDGKTCASFFADFDLQNGTVLIG